MSGLFATFNVGKRGLFAQQQAINTTSHNIANANTEGYSRQRATMETTRPFGMPSMDNQVGPGQIGTGVEVSSIQRIRDNFMDFQVRREKSTLGQYEARDKYLSEIENIFNEPSDTGISTLIGKFFDSWEKLSKQAETSNARTIVAQQSAALADSLNHTYNQMIEVKKNAQQSIKQSVFDANSILEQIDELNQQIMSVKVSGMEPNDLMDRRDLLLDQLSQKFNINVEGDKFNTINLKPDYTLTPEHDQDINNPLLVRKNPNDAVRRFSYVKSIKSGGDEVNSVKTIVGGPGNYSVELDVTYLKNGDVDEEATLKLKISSDKGTPAEALKDINEQFKRFEQCRVIWGQSDKNNDEKNGLAIKINGAEIKNGDTVDFNNLALFELADDKNRGEFKGFMSVQKDVDQYIDQLNKLAKAIAYSVNAIHSGRESAGNSLDPTGTPLDADYMPFFVNSDAFTGVNKAKYDTSTGKNILYNGGSVDDLNKVLLAESEITAANISINKQILDDVMQIKTRIKDNEFTLADLNDIDAEKDGKRALAIASLRNTLLQIQNIDSASTDRAGFISMMGGLQDNSEFNLKTIKSDIKGMKVDNYFTDTISKIGVQGQEAQRIVKNQGVLLQGFQERRDSISGVSLDEEMANLIQFQHAYQANAKIITTVDELLDVVVNGLKR